MNYASIVLDIIVLLICISIVIKSYQRGFIDSLVTFVGYIVAIFAAFYLNKICASFVYDSFIKQSVVNNIQNIISSQDAAVMSIAEIAGAVLIKLPSFIVSNSISALGGKENLISSIELKSDGRTNRLAPIMADTVVAPVVNAILQIIFFLLIFAICVIIVKLVAQFLHGINRIPIIGTLNRILGGVLGLAKAAIAVLLLSLVISLLIMFFGDKIGWLNETLLESSFFFKHIDIQKII